MQIAAHLAHHIRQVAVDAEIPVYRFGVRVGRVTVLVRPQYDQALGMTADIYVSDENEDLHSIPSVMVPGLLDEIEKEDETAWRDILAASGKAAA